MKQTRKRNYRIRKNIIRAAQIVACGGNENACCESALIVAKAGAGIGLCDITKADESYIKQALNLGLNL